MIFYIKAFFTNILIFFPVARMVEYKLFLAIVFVILEKLWF